MTPLPDRPTLRDFQDYVRTVVKERGFADETVPEVFILFLEECGELAKAARKAQNMKTDAQSKTHDVGQEAADVFIHLLDLCNRLGVDLEESFRGKEEVNRHRTWS